MARCSILIPAYNNTEEQKMALIQSINRQSAIQDIQVILIDDGSNLELKWTSDFLSKYLHCNYKFFVNNNNQGVGFSRNRIFNAIDTDYFCFLDSDDSFYDDTIIEQYITFLDSHLNYDAIRSLIYSDYQKTVSSIEELIDSLNLHGLCGRTCFFKKHNINFPLIQ